MIGRDSKTHSIDSINVMGASNIYGTTPKFKTPKTCKYCKKQYVDYNTYGGFCSWTCKSKYIKKKLKKENEND